MKPTVTNRAAEGMNPFTQAQYRKRKAAKKRQRKARKQNRAK